MKQQQVRHPAIINHHKPELVPDLLDPNLRHLPESLRLCNCAGCGCILAHLDDEALGRRYGVPEIDVRIDERPFCSFCSQITDKWG